MKRKFLFITISTLVLCSLLLFFYFIIINPLNKDLNGLNILIYLFALILTNLVSIMMRFSRLLMMIILLCLMVAINWNYFLLSI